MDSLRTAPTIIIQTVAESEEIGTNHLGFAKSLFQYYHTHFELTNNSWPTESAFNCYVNERIVYHLRDQGDPEFTFNNFFSELFQTISLWEITNSKEEESSNWEVNKQNLILEHSEIKTLVNQTLENQNNQNSDVINQHLPPVIIINLLPAPPNAQQQQQPQLLPQQQIQQQPQPNLDSMAYAPIAKLKKFTGKENNTQIWLNDVEKAIAANKWNDTRAMQAISYFFQNTANSWYQSLVNKSQDFNAFKIEFLRYFSNNNSINRLANTFTTIKQRENEAITTYLGHFYRNLHQIQVINANYFTVVQILNQFIHGLCTAITNAQDFKAAELEAKYTQAINLVMNGSSELDSKLKQFKSVTSIIINQLTVTTKNACLPLLAISSELHTYNTATLSSTSISSTNLSTDNTDNLLAAVTTHLSAAVSGNLLAPTNSNTATELTSKQNPKAKINPTKLEIVNDAQPNNPETNQQPTLTSNIPPATITENESLDTIFLFKLEEPSTTPLFNGATLKEKPIMAIYTDAKVDGHSIKLILNSRSAGSIITKQLIDQLSYQVDCAASARIITTNGTTKTPIGEINNFPIEVNSIMVPIKVLVMEATQYQALIGNNWLSKTNVLFD
ncbi:hypothetical protein G9A89_012341 [Geosiphon pyriformis]|nr:hypothetical protein G9A89_012341 [Geosiphon pyriformis]